MILAVLSFFNKYKGGGMYIIFASNLFGIYCFCGKPATPGIEVCLFFFVMWIRRTHVNAIPPGPHLSLCETDNIIL